MVEKESNPQNVLSRRPEPYFFKALNELAALKQHFVFRCSDCFAIRDSISLQKNIIPINTSSCGMFLGLLPFSLVSLLLIGINPSTCYTLENNSDNSTSYKCLFVRNVFERLAKRHGARSAVTALPLGLSKNVFERLAKRHVARSAVTACRLARPRMFLSVNEQTNYQCFKGCSLKKTFRTRRYL